jgi:hypothetical protein
MVQRKETCLWETKSWNCILEITVYVALLVAVMHLWTISNLQWYRHPPWVKTFYKIVLSLLQMCLNEFLWSVSVAIKNLDSITLTLKLRIQAAYVSFQHHRIWQKCYDVRSKRYGLLISETCVEKLARCVRWVCKSEVVSTCWWKGESCLNGGSLCIYSCLHHFLKLCKWI